MSNICQWMLGQKLLGTPLVCILNGDGLFGTSRCRQHLKECGNAPWLLWAWSRTLPDVWDLSTTAVIQWQLHSQPRPFSTSVRAWLIPYQAGQMHWRLREDIELVFIRNNGLSVKRERCKGQVLKEISERACLQSACRNHDMLLNVPNSSALQQSTCWAQHVLSWIGASA